MHGEHYTGDAGLTQEKTYKNPHFERLPAMRFCISNVLYFLFQFNKERK